MFVKWYGLRHPRNIGQPEIEGFLAMLANERRVAALLSVLPTDMALLARLLYGTGMRLMEGLRLRVKDVGLDRGVVVVRQAKGDKDRVVMLSHSLAAELRQKVLAARAM